MKDSRKGEALWSEWEGYGHHYEFGDVGLLFYTEEHVDVENEVVRRALASCLQRDGVVSSLSEGFRLIDNGKINQTYAGPVNEDIYWTICDDEGYTTEGTEVDSIHDITVVEVAYE
jgi:hypothetical protein